MKKIISAALTLLLLIAALSSCSSEKVQPTEKATETRSAAETVESTASVEKSSAEEILSSMTTEDKISQMLMPAFRNKTEKNGTLSAVTKIDGDIASALKKHGFAGVILFESNTSENAAAARFVDSLQKANEGHPQLIISIDQEGGSVTRLGQGTVMPGNMALGAADDIDVTKEAASVIGKELTALGINADFAPDVDINSNPANPIIGIRSFSDDAETVARHGAAFVKAMNGAGVISTLKHFPGHGDTDTDSHTGLPLINKSRDELEKNELIPFKECIEAGAQMIMTAHIQYPQIEKNTYKSTLTGEKIHLPATLSKTIVTDILRGDLGYDGVVTTDAMNMDAIAKHFDKFDAARLAIEAGVDILLMPVDTSSKAGIKSIDSYVSTLAKMADEGEISMRKIDAAVLRILTLKESRGLLKPYESGDVESLALRAVDRVGTKVNHDAEWRLAKKCVTLAKNENKTLPLSSKGKKTVILAPYDDEIISVNYAVKMLKSDGKLSDGAEVEVHSYENKSALELLPMISGADNIVFISELYSVSELGGKTAETADALADDIHSRGGRFIVLSVNLPYDIARYDKADAIMLAYLPRSMAEDPSGKAKEIKKYGANMPAALYMMFSAEDAPSAKLPVDIPKLSSDFTLSDDILYKRGTQSESY